MAKINYDYCEEKVLYDSGNIETEVLTRYKEGKKPTEFDENFFYPLTPIRENIINWYPFKTGATILEVGGGMGSITGPLCKNAKKVVSCEYSKRRAECLYHRHKDKDNLEVIVGNLNKVKFKDKFDYIVLIGVFEYAIRFCNTDNPFVDFLANLKKNLKPDGIILIAIENRYGIKYWAGSMEDHYPEKYISLLGYGKDYDIQTLGKQELIKIFNQVGLTNHKFYYPYPDYKMPYIITTDKREFFPTEISSLRLYNHGDQKYNFDYRKVIPGLIENGVYGFFANSFLVEISSSSKNISDIEYVKTNWNRAIDYQINTIIKENKTILKVPKNKSTIRHLDNMIKTHNDIEKLGISISKIIKKDNAYEIEYMEGIELTEYISELTRKKDKTSILNEIENYYRILKSISYKSTVKKTVNKEQEKFYNNSEVELLKIGLFDLHFSNIIKNNEKYSVIDQEWCTDKDIPLNYMLYFAIYYLFEWIEDFKDLFSLEELMNKYGIDSKEIKLFRKMSIDLSRKISNVCIKTAKSTEAQNIVEFIDEQLKDTEKQIKILNDSIEQQRQVISSLSEEVESQKQQYHEIINSRRWHYANKIANLKGKISFKK